MRQTRAGEVWLAGTMYIPVWPSRWLLPLSGALMLIYLVLRVIRDVARGHARAGEGELDGLARVCRSSASASCWC